MEMLYWRIQYWKEKQFNSSHFELFFTDYFSLSKDDYQDKIVVDIGCGPRGSLEWATNTKKNIGIDPLAEKYKQINSFQNMELINARAEDLPFDNESVDFISSFNSLDHVEDVDLSIKEIGRVLKAGGKFLLILELHPFSTICEPNAVHLEVVDKLKNHFQLHQLKVYEGDNSYKSIRKAVQYNFENKSKRYGVLTVLCEK